jgi:hypothetical protein
MQELILNAYPPPAPITQKKTKKPNDQKKGQRPQATTATVSDLADGVENLQVENGTSTKNQNGSS